MIAVGDIVLYRPDKRLPEFHDRGCEPILPAVVVKVWDLSVCDLQVLLDGPGYVFVNSVPVGDKVGQWRHKP